MTTQKLTLPERLAREADAAGLLNPNAIKRLLRAEIRRQRVEKLFRETQRLAAVNLPQLTGAEIETEIQTVRAQRRANARRR